MVRQRRLLQTLSALAAALVAGAPAHADGPDRWRDPRPDLPDLSVRFIERLPRYPGTRVEYRPIDEGPNGLKGDGLPARVVHPEQQRWPRAGQPVTFIAHLRNSGATPTPRYDWHWLLDGQEAPGEAGGGWDEPLAPGAERTYRLSWRWQEGHHGVAFEVNRGRKFAEITYKNDFVVDYTDALAFHFFVQPRVYAWFEGVKNGLDSYSWDDWAQFQVREMNREFRDEIHPATPDGITLRVRLDQITLLPEEYPDPGGTHAPEDNVSGGSDGVWGFTNDLLKKNAAGKSFYEANPQWLLGPEWPLHHELGHQLGQPDYYLLPVTPERNGALPGVGYMPPGWFQDQMMFSGNYAHDNASGASTPRGPSTGTAPCAAASSAPSWRISPRSTASSSWMSGTGRWPARPWRSTPPSRESTATRASPPSRTLPAPPARTAPGRCRALPTAWSSTGPATEPSSSWSVRPAGRSGSAT